MRIVIPDGWPFASPKIFVDGINSEHVNAPGEVCLWMTTDEEYGWRDLAGIRDRAEHWVAEQKKGFDPETVALDAHLYFEKYEPVALAVLDLGSLKAKSGGKTPDKLHLADREIMHGLWLERGSKERVVCHLYHPPKAPSPPPRTLEEFEGLLTEKQRRNLGKRKREVVESGNPHIVGIFWDGPAGRNAQLLRMEKADKTVKATAFEVAPTDERYRLARAGPDSDVLREKRAAVFGVGAIGSNATLIASECGVGMLRLVDGQWLRPADLIRHIGQLDDVGDSKVAATRRAIKGHFTNTNVETVAESSWKPTQLKQRIHDVDVVLEATGSGRFSDLVGRVAAEAGKPLVSTALYRGGAVGAVRLQAVGSTPFRSTARRVSLSIRAGGQ